MIKGWRNNPAWVKHYQEVADARNKKRISRMIAIGEQSALNERIKRDIESIKRQRAIKAFG